MMALDVRPRCDSHAAGIGGDVGEESERRVVALSLDLHEERRRLPPDETLEGSHPERPLADQALERRVDRTDQRSIETDTRHQQKVALPRTPDRDAASTAGGD